jgi:beta-lactamase class A
MRIRSSLLLTLVLLSLLGVSAAGADDTSALSATAGKVADLISDKPTGVAELFSRDFLAAVPEDKLVSLLQSIHGSNGAVKHIELKSHQSSWQGAFAFTFKNSEIPVTLVIDAAEPHRVTGLWFGPPVPLLKTLEDVTNKLSALPGTVSFQLQRLDDGKVLASLNPDKALAIGSAFKLYILATLDSQQVAWDKVVRLEDRYKSFPGGEMQDWPTGAPVTVHTLALKMISISDNTATDHLLALAGRHNVEAMLPKLGMKNPSADVPLLATLEMFRLKSDPELRKKYLAADAAGRDKLLGELLGTARPALQEVVQSLAKPNSIDTIEWFASAADLCRVMQWFDAHGSETVLGILAINPALNNRAEKFSYIGFKGGSDTGVLNFTWLLRQRGGAHYALSASWNNPDKAVDLAELMGLLNRAVDLLPDAK